MDSAQALAEANAIATDAWKRARMREKVRALREGFASAPPGCGEPGRPCPHGGDHD